MASHINFNNVCKLFCLVPISLNPHIQRALTVYSWLTIGALILDIIFSFSVDVFGDGYLVSSLATSVVFLSVVVSHIVAIVEALNKRKGQRQFFAKLKKTDGIFRYKLLHKIELRPIQRRLLIKYSILSFVVLFNFLLYIGTILTHNYEGFFWHGFVSVTVSRIRFIQLSIYVELISYRFEHLNILLEQIANSMLCRGTTILDVNLIENSEKIFVLKLIYTKLSDTVQCFNDIFGWSTLFFVVYYCLDFTCNIYWQFLAWEHYIHASANFECFATLCPLGLLFALYCSTCNKCVNKSSVTRQIVQKMILTSSDEHTNYLLNEFLLLIHHQPIVIHTKKFLCIDLKLLSSILASIIGYLVILLQFRYTENEL